MAWTRIDDKFLMNPKVQQAGAYGLALYLSGLIYSNSNMTDGFIPDVMLPVIGALAFQTNAKKTASVLVGLNLWESVEGGYRIHDFLDFNKSRSEIENMNQARVANGSKGGRPNNLTPNLTHNQNITETKPSQVIKNNLTPNLAPNHNETWNEPINPNTLIPIPIKDKEAAAAISENPSLSDAVSAYEEYVGVLTPGLLKLVETAVADHPDGWVVDAIREAAGNQARSWNYIAAILKRWKAEGRGGKPSNGNGRKPQAGSYEAWKARKL